MLNLSPKNTVVDILPKLNNNESEENPGDIFLRILYAIFLAQAIVVYASVLANQPIWGDTTPREIVC